MGSQAFKAKRGNLWQFDPNDLVIIGLDTKHGPEHELWDERTSLPLEEETVINMMAIGVIQTVTIRKVDGQAEVVDGRRRVLHAREANKRLTALGESLIAVPCALEHGDEVHMEGVAIALNEHRVDDNVITKAQKAVRLLGRNGGDTKAAANHFNVTTTTIKNWTKLVELAPKVRKAVERGDISASAATQLHGMGREEQAKQLEAITADAKKAGKKRPTTKAAKSKAGKTTMPGKRVLMKLITDEELADKLDPAMVHGIKLALGEHLPGATSKMGKLLAKAGYTY